MDLFIYLRGWKKREEGPIGVLITNGASNPVDVKPFLPSFDTELQELKEEIESRGLVVNGTYDNHGGPWSTSFDSPRNVSQIENIFMQGSVTIGIDYRIKEKDIQLSVKPADRQ